MEIASRALLVLAEHRGRVAGVAWQLRDRLRRRGFAVEVTTALHLGRESEHDVVVLGAAHGSSLHRRAIGHYIDDNRATLERIPSALFLVAGVRAPLPGEALRAFEGAVAWRPTTVGTLVCRRRERGARRVVTSLLRSMFGASETHPCDELDELAAALRRAATYRGDRTRSRSDARRDVLKAPSRFS